MQLMPLLDNGNYTEVFAIPVIFGVIYLFAVNKPSKNALLLWIVIGCLGATAFFLKQSLVGIWISIFVILILKAKASSDYRSAILRIGLIVLGFVIVFVYFVFYFYTHGALTYFWDAVFRYNLAYSGTSNNLIARFKVPVLGIIFTTIPTGLGIIAIVSWFVAFSFIINHKQGEHHIILALVLINVPIEFVLASITGRFSPHYFIPLLPTFSILVGFFVFRFLIYPRDTTLSLDLNKKSSTLKYTLFAVMLLFPFFSLIWKVGDGIPKPLPSINHRKVVSDYIRVSTSPMDYVLLWGAEASINFSSGRLSPTRFVYQYPLYTHGYHDASMVEEFMRHLKLNSPALIVDGWRGTDKIPPIDAKARSNWNTSWNPHYQTLPEMQAVLDYIALNYVLVDSIGPDRWPVYKRINKPNDIPKKQK